MSIFDRYMAARFLRPFLFGLGVFALLIFLGDLFDKLPRLVKSPANLWEIVQYLWLEVPYWGVRVIPMATLLATLFAVTGFIQSGEWIAVQASGFETRSFFRPILLMALLVTACSFAAQESILPACYRRAQRLWRDRIHPEWEWDEFQKVVLVPREGWFVSTPKFVVGKGWMQDPVVDYSDAGRQIAAKEGQWDPKAFRWVFKNGVERTFGPGGLPAAEKPFTFMTSDIDVAPKELAPRTQSPDEMSILETWRYLRRAHRFGGGIREAREALHSKLAYPFSNLILCALGIPIALRLGRAGKIVGFALALGVSFAYLCVMEMGFALGVADLLHPVVAAWMANAMFGASAAWLYRRAELWR